MKVAQIIHNPTSGNAGHNKADLLEMAQKAGYEVNYASTHEDGWKNFVHNTFDVIILAGGDGTVHKLAGVLLNNNMLHNHFPIHLLPLGTANNIAKTFKISPEIAQRKINCTIEGTKNFDCGRLRNLQDEKFFLESVGFGIFPELITEMEKNEIEDETPSEELQRTLKVLLEIVKKYKAQKATIKVEGITIKGSFLLVELMNTKFIGPNFELAPNANPGDGYFDLVMIPEKNRAELEDYLGKMIQNNHENADLQKFVKTLRIQKVKMKWGGPKVHVDDNIVKDYSGKKFKVEVTEGALEIV